MYNITMLAQETIDARLHPRRPQDHTMAGGADGKAGHKGDTEQARQCDCGPQSMMLSMSATGAPPGSSSS